MADWIRVSEALALEPRDMRLDTDGPTLRIREYKKRKSREVPVHPELQGTRIAATSYGAFGGGPLVDVSRTTAWRRCPSRRGTLRTPPQAEVADFEPKSATSAPRRSPLFGAQLVTLCAFGRVRLAFCQHECTALLEGRADPAPAGLAGGAQPAPGSYRGPRHVAVRSACRRGSELEWRDLDYSGRTAGAPGPEVEEPAGSGL